MVGSILGCEDFLVENPPSEISLNNVTDENIEGLVIGAYEPLSRSRGRIWESHFSTQLELLAEYTRSNGTRDITAQYDFFTGNRNFWNMWPTIYEAIGRSNIILQSLENNNQVTESLKNQAIGETSFIRAICYYTLVRAYGSVPMRLVPVENSQETGQPLESVDNLYAQIISDLLVAESNLPATTNNPGRATSGAAKVALADVYLTRGDFQSARDKSKEVLDNADTYGYALLDSYPDVFSPTAPTHAEDVFSIKFSQVPDFGNFSNTYAAPRSPATIASDAGIAARGLNNLSAVPSTPLIANWSDNDLRKSWNLYDEVVIDGEIVPVQTRSNGGATLFFGKYRDPDAVEETASGNDFYLYRFADVLLIFAEAENQVNGPTAEAYEAVNQIRRRGYGVDMNTPNAEVDFPSGLSQEDFDELIFQERGWEFMFEGKRWFDLKRTGRWETIIPAAGKPVPTQLIYPLPDEEIQNNPDLN